MSEATVFSQVRSLSFAAPLTRIRTEQLLEKFSAALGQPLSSRGIVPGHIKVLAELPASEEFLFLSVTRTDRVDVKRSADWSNAPTSEIAGLRLNINVLVFGFSLGTVEQVVDTAYGELINQSKKN